MCSDNGVWGLALETADTGTLGWWSGNSEESRFTPVSTPWVLKDPVVVSTVWTVSNNEDTVVKAGSAWGIRNDTTVVWLEDWLISFNSNWNGTLSNSSHKLSWVVGWDIIVWGNSNNTFWLLVVAWTVLSSVGIVAFGFELVLFDVLEGIVHKTTITTIVTEWAWAINELLFWEWDKITSLDGASTFNGTSGGEWPAWSTLTLVLNWGNSILGSPVNWSWETSGVEDGGSFVVSSESGVVSEHHLEFSWGHVSELVDG